MAAAGTCEGSQSLPLTETTANSVIGTCIDYSKTDANAPGTGKEKMLPLKGQNWVSTTTVPILTTLSSPTNKTETNIGIDKFTSTTAADVTLLFQDEKVCINWKTKGKCRKVTEVSLQHDEGGTRLGKLKACRQKNAEWW
jgi:hypothetical protein